MSRGRVIADLDAGTKRDTAVSELVGLITASQDTVGDSLRIANSTPVERA
jgi:hypothetical protein